jgi:hypothetical protein
MAASRERPKAPRCPQPLSRASRLRILRGLVERANAGDIPAAEALVRLAMLAETGMN